MSAVAKPAAKQYDFSSLNVNAKSIAEVGTEKTGLALLKLISEELEISDWSSARFLDVGCGVRFTQTMLNNGIDIGHYCGVDIMQSIIELLNAEVDLPNYEFHHWDVYNNLYNKPGTEMADFKALPGNTQDLQFGCLISVFTHLNKDDSNSLLRILRASMPKGAKILFSAFIEDDFEGDFIEVFPENPSRTVKHKEASFTSLIEQNGWKITKFSKKRPECYINDYFVCEAV